MEIEMSTSEYNDFSAFQRIVDIADAEYDGHVTIMKFTGGWKIIFGTPGMDQDDRENLWNACPNHATLPTALKHAIANRPTFYLRGLSARAQSAEHQSAK